MFLLFQLRFILEAIEVTLSFRILFPLVMSVLAGGVSVTLGAVGLVNPKHMNMEMLGKMGFITLSIMGFLS
jgi:hypothetical protein